MGVDAEMGFFIDGELKSKQLARYSFELAEAFGAWNFLIQPESGEHAISIPNLAWQNRVDVDSAPNPQLVEARIYYQVNLFGRYYNVGYERGNLPLYCSIADWIESRFHGPPIFYGGDHRQLFFFGYRQRCDLLQYFYQYGHRPYVLGDESSNSSEPFCSFCQAQTRIFRLAQKKEHRRYECMGCRRVWIPNGDSFTIVENRSADTN